MNTCINVKILGPVFGALMPTSITEMLIQRNNENPVPSGGDFPEIPFF